MSKTKKLTLSAMIASICVVILLLSALVPNVKLSITALAGIFPAAVVIACGSGWAFGTYAAAGLLALLLIPGKTAAVWFLCFFGHYPIWKLAIERLQTKVGNQVFGWLLKLLGFTVCMMGMYLLLTASFDDAIPAKLREWSVGPAVLLPILLIAFAIYDVAFSILVGWFRVRILPKLK